ncbi:alpha/beta fold hydrolase [Mammaliicoccus sciuri]|uniref:Proline-specific peptidase n=1 Tax=Sporosarcina newyorkensis TaxID=759851 RepID=A0A1T4Y9Z8_9BACL|nr:MULTISPECIES: alpha/beta fold hydrolase [Sporosarcina]MBY0223207.1 alpha/beta fold hydrolase [Sporosarcina aquimarina]SKA98121.1 proline-specific peptidase [Sporosarcina newyorkensis]
MSNISYDQETTLYKEKGVGEPLIFIHGVGLDHAMWQQQVNRLSANYRVITYDMLGHGGSSHPPGPYSLSQFVEQLSTLVNKLKLPKVNIVGFSMGAMVAQSFAAKFPEKIRTLTIMNSVANRTSEQRKAIAARVEEVKKLGPQVTIEPAIQRWFNQEFQEKNQEIVNEVRHRLETNNADGYIAAYTLFATADEEVWQQLKDITVPSLIITGEYDVGSTPEMSQQIHEKLLNSELLVVPDTRHMLPVEKPEIVNQAIHSFIQKHVN